jgi:hypothetical protein
LVVDIADPVDGLAGLEALLVVGPGVAYARLVDLEASPVGADVAEGVVDVGELASLPGGVDVLDGGVTPVDPPLGEVADLYVGPRSLGRGDQDERGGGCGDDCGDQEREVSSC